MLGQAFAFEDLQALAGLSEDELETALEEALAAGLVYEARDDYVFNHALTQQALYTELGIPEIYVKVTFGEHPFQALG